MPYRYLELTAADRNHLAALGAFIREDLESILTEIATTLRDAEEIQKHLPPGDLREQMRPGLQRYLTALTSGKIEPYLEAVVDQVRQQVTDVLPYLSAVIAMMAFETVIVRRFLEANVDVANRSAGTVSFLKFNQIALMAIANAYLEAKETTTRAQQEALLALSTPVVEVWQGILALPLIGTIDTARAKQITQSLLRSIRETQARAPR